MTCSQEYMRLAPRKGYDSGAELAFATSFKATPGLIGVNEALYQLLRLDITS